MDVSGLTSGVTAIAAGEFHTCALVSGGVKCWGDNSNGQLGNNNAPTDSSVPVNVSGLTSGVSAITAGGNHSCALLSTGAVKCWGRGGQGQLGNGSYAQSDVPVQVSGLTSGVTFVHAGHRHTCAVVSGGARCWGENVNGQLGDNSTANSNVPVQVNGLTSSVAGVRAGGSHTCARLTSGEMKCWGLNSNGQLGDGTTTQRLTPVMVSGIASGAVSMGIGYAHSCVMMTGNIMKCWGSNSDGQLSQDGIAYWTTPLGVVFASTVYTYDPNHKHAVSALSTLESYGYDANGNMITRVEGGITYTQTFDAENRLISITAGGLTTQFIYDGDGNLVKKIKTDGSRNLYVGGIFEVDKNSSGTQTGTKTYYPAGGAMRVTVTSPASNTLYYVLKDHLGSASVLTTNTGVVITGADIRYYPFGEARSSTTLMLTDKLFTGQREITGLGIYHYGARFYSPKLGRFLSADTMTSNPDNPQRFNRYTYGSNNPLRYSDPTGHRACDDVNDAGECITAPGGGGRGFGGSQPRRPRRGGGRTPSVDPGHDYYTVYPVCPAIFHCTQEEAFEYLTHFQYPGQWPWDVVINNGEEIVLPARIWRIRIPFIPSDLGAIRTVFGDDGRSIINRTQPPHIFHQGLVERRLEQVDGTWYVVTHGTGTNIRTPNPNINRAIDEVNQLVGSTVFMRFVDSPMSTWVAVDQTIQDVGSLISDWVP